MKRWIWMFSAIGALLLGGTAHLRTGDRFTGSQAEVLIKQVAQLEVKVSRNELELASLPPGSLLARVGKLENKIGKMGNTLTRIETLLENHSGLKHPHRFPRESQ